MFTRHPCSRSWFRRAIAGTFLLSAARLVLGQLPNPPTSQPVGSSYQLAEALNREATALQVKDVLEIKAYQRWPLVEWMVQFDAEALTKRLDAESASKPADEVARWFNWYRTLNQSLLEITRRESLLLGTLNIETDVSTEFLRGSLTNRVYCDVCKFRGSRCTYIDRPPVGFDRGAGETTIRAASDAQITVTIQPAKTVWKARETISGSVFWENTGKQRIAMRPIEMPEVQIRRVGGQTLERLTPKMFICSTPIASMPPIVLMPGERHQTLFSIETDPLALQGAVLLEEGRYEVFMPDLNDSLNIPTVCKPVSVEMRTDAAQNLSPRIIFFGAGGSRLVVVRENGDLAAYEIESGRRVAQGHVADYSPMPWWEGEFEVSPDGMQLALVREPYGGPTATGIDLFELEGDAKRRELSLPAESDPFSRPRLASFSPDGKLLFLTSRANFWALDSSKGDIKWKTNRSDKEWLSPDARWRISPSEQEIEFSPRESPDNLTRISFSEGNHEEFAHVGRQGIYAIDQEKRALIYYGFDGRQRSRFGEQIESLLAETPDASEIAIRERQEDAWIDDGPIAFWKVDPPRRLWRLADEKPRQVVFAGSPLRVVCGLRTGAGLGVETYSTMFEVYDSESGKLLKTLDAR